MRYWRKAEDSETSSQRVVVSSRENQTRLENMRPNSPYLIEVRAYNAAGYGPPSQHLQIYTKKARAYFYLRAGFLEIKEDYTYTKTFFNGVSLLKVC